MKTPILKYVAIVAFAALAALVTFNVAHAAEAQPANPMQTECTEAVPEMLGPVFAAHKQGIPADVIEVLVRTDETVPPLARGIILRAIPSLRLDPTLEQFFDFGAALCALKPVSVPVQSAGPGLKFPKS